MIGVAIVTGDVVNSMGFGTVTQVYGDKFVAFGHDMFRDGKAALPVYRAVVDGIVASTQISYKSATAYGNPIGTITKDLRPGIVGELGKLPPMIPVTVFFINLSIVQSQFKHTTKWRMVKNGQYRLSLLQLWMQFVVR